MSRELPSSGRTIEQFDRNARVTCPIARALLRRQSFEPAFDAPGMNRSAGLWHISSAVS